MDAEVLKWVGFDAGDLKGAGFNAEELHEAGFDAWELFQARSLKEADFDARQLKAGEARAYKDQAEGCQNIGPLSVPRARARTGSIYGETDTRKRPFGIPGPSGATLGDFGGEVRGSMYAIVSPGK